MRKFISLLVVCLCLCLCACGAEQTTESTAETEQTECTVVDIAEETNEDITEPEESPCVFENYEYKHSDPRDLKWERDVVYLAKAFLGVYPAEGHPLLADKESRVYYTGGIMKMESYYNAELRIRFTEQILDLIDNIPILSDTDILYEMQRIIAELSDAHSSLGIPVVESFAVTVEPFYTDAGVQLHAVRLPVEYSDCLYAQLVSINGVSIDEVISSMSKYISTENEYRMMFLLTNLIYNGLLYEKGSLQAIDVVGDQDDTAVFEFITGDGEHIFAELLAVTPEEYRQIDKVMGDWYSSEQFSFSHFSSTYYWYDFEETNGTLYIRFNYEFEMTDYRYSAFIADFKNAVSGHAAEKLIVDLRFNPGGNMQVSQDFVDAFTDMDFEEIYILIDGGSCSNAVVLAAELRQKLPNALLVGVPAGQPANFFAAPKELTLPNSGYAFTVSDMWYEYWTGYPYDALMPDITIYQTLEDYTNGVDTVLEAVLAMGE